jgi:hypothetical protein
MNTALDRLDDWLRGDFVVINTQLEEAYFASRVDVISGRPELDALKSRLLREGGRLIDHVAAAPLPGDARAQYRILGLVGHYLAACQRHEADVSNREACRAGSWDISTRIGDALSVTPRFVFAHQSLFNEAAGGRFHTFTSLPDEEIFLRFNALAVLGYRRAANALRDVADMGVSNPVASYLFEDAKAALGDVLRFNQQLGQQLDVDRFFFNIRPYFKSYKVNDIEYRGANAGDFAAINEIDVILGVCQMSDDFYRSVVEEKRRHVPPDDLPLIAALTARRSLLNLFVRELDSIGATSAWQTNAALFVDVCKAHAGAYAVHHQRLVKGFLEKPAMAAPTAHGSGVTSSGPPLDQVITMLQRLLDLRSMRHPDLARIQQALRQWVGFPRKPH